jgi:hypothetical protein
MLMQQHHVRGELFSVRQVGGKAICTQPDGELLQATALLAAQRDAVVQTAPYGQHLPPFRRRQLIARHQLGTDQIGYQCGRPPVVRLRGLRPSDEGENFGSGRAEP